MFAATVLWASTATLARFMFHARAVDPLVVVELRLTIASIVLAACLATFRRSALRIASADLPRVLVLGLFGVAAVQGSYYYSISKLGVGLAILIQYLAPALIVAFDLVRGRRVGWTMIVAVLCALAGTVMLVGGARVGQVHASPLDWGVAFFSALAFAFYIVNSKQVLARYAPETVLLYTFAIAAIFWAFRNPPWVIAAAHYPPEIWGMFLLLGLFSTLVPFTLFYMGLRRLPAAEAGVIATSEPLVAMVTAAVFLGERLGPMQLVGATFVVTAALLASRNKPEATEANVERG
ncbi:MAG: EamA family transporter [Candidatus Eisenbacteria bacterium]|uniref:EamA family transporter n=1 Tax=Eiseniibacteriota bacterium TaxID=2212470 RepID=A0A933SE75_UNCEI|nr:EamA family transporter [Candidatus Eisenbacteria bacterium]